jgi:hypothetical protein
MIPHSSRKSNSFCEKSFEIFVSFFGDFPKSEPRWGKKSKKTCQKKEKTP